LADFSISQPEAAKSPFFKLSVSLRLYSNVNLSSDALGNVHDWCCFPVAVIDVDINSLTM